MLTTATIDLGLTGWALAAFLFAGVCLFVAYCSRKKRWLAGTVCLFALGTVWMISALSMSVRTEQLTVADLYYTYGNCKEQADAPMTNDESCGLHPITIDYIKTDEGTFQDSGSLWDRMQVGRTYTCRVENFKVVVSPVIKSCVF